MTEKEYLLEKNDAILLVPGVLRQRSEIPDNIKFVIINYYPNKENELRSTVFFKNAVNQSILNLLNACPCNIYATDKINDMDSPDNQKNIYDFEKYLELHLYKKDGKFRLFVF